MPVAIPFIIAMSNLYLRGGAIKDWWPKAFGGKVAHALIFGLCCYLSNPITVYGLLMALAMYIGQAPALFKESSDDALIDRRLLDWCIIVWERAAVWVAPIALVSAYYNGISALLWLIPLVLMPACYSFIWWYKGNAWRWAEFTFGIALGLPLIF